MDAEDACTTYWGVSGRRQLGGTHRSCTCRAARRLRQTSWRPDARPCWPRGSDGCGRRATASSSRRGTGWRCAHDRDGGAGARPRTSCGGDAPAGGLRARRTCCVTSDALWRTARDGRAHTPGFAEDYANLADGLLAAHAALGMPEDLRAGRAADGSAGRRLLGRGSGTLFDTAEEHDRAVTRPRSIVDSATPSANAVAADVLLRLALLTGEADYDRRARSILRAVAPALDRQPSAVRPHAERRGSQPIRSRSTPWSPVTRQTRPPSRCAAPWPGRTLPDLVIAARSPDGDMDGWPLFEGKVARDGLATAYVCRGYACEAPTTDPKRGGGAGRAHDAQPGRKLSRTVRVAWSEFGSSSATDCQVPSAMRPSTTGTTGTARPAAAGRDPRRGRAIRGGAASGRHAAGADPARPSRRHPSRCRSPSPPGPPWHAARRCAAAHRRLRPSHAGNRCRHR